MDGVWSLVALWVLLPGLRRTVARLSARFRADAEDICSAVLLGALEGLREIAPDQPDIGRLLWRRASSGGWQVVRAAWREYPAEDVEVAGGSRRARAGDAWAPAVVHRGIPDSAGEIGADPGRREGERLGSVAHRMGLGETVRAARLCTGARTAGHVGHPQRARRSLRPLRQREHS